MYYSENDEKTNELLTKYMVADKLKTSVGLNVSDKDTNNILYFEWKTIKNDSIRNKELYEFNDMTKIFIRPHFDIDYKWNELNNEQADSIKELAIYKIKDYFNVSVNDIAISQNHRNDKCSFHMVITNIMTTMDSLSKWANDCKDDLLIDHFDLSIYRKGLNKWRMLNTIKRVNNSTDLVGFKKDSSHNDIDYLITYTNPSTMKIVIYKSNKQNNNNNHNNHINNINNNVHNENSDNINNNDTINEDEIIEKLSLVKESQVDNYNDTIKFIWSCVSTKSSKIIDKCRDICKLNKKYYEDESWFDNIVNSYDDSHNFTIGTALLYAKEANINKFIKITNKYKGFDNDEQKIFEQVIDTNYDHAIAKLFCKLFPNNILFYQGDTYYFKDGYWTFIDDNYHSIKRLLSNEYYKIFLNKLTELQSKLTTLDNKSNDYNITKYRINNINKICYKLQTNHSKEAIIKEIFVASSHSDVQFDNKSNLLNFKNGTLDLSTNVFYNHNPLDYLTKIIPYDYEPTKYSSEIKNEFINKVSSIFPTKEELDYVLWRIAKCYHGSNFFQEAIFWIGEGRNGKGILSDLAADAFGTYHNSMNVSYMTSYDKHPNGPNAELLKLKGCRFVIINESDTTQPINSIKFKSLTGNDIISVRDLFKKATQFVKFKPQFTPLFLTNSVPTFTKMDDAVLSRLCYINFPFYFGNIGDNKFNSSNPKHKIRNNNLLNELKNNINVFIHVLLDYYFNNKTMDKPLNISNYHNKVGLETNTVISFCMDVLEEKKNNKVGIFELYKLYKESSNYDNISLRLFSDRIMNFYSTKITDKRVRINNRLQYAILDYKLKDYNDTVKDILDDCLISDEE